MCKDFELKCNLLQAELNTVQARVDLAKWQLKQADTLATQQVLPEEQLQEKRAQLTILQGELAVQKVRIDLTERQIGQCQVKAPFTGTVTLRSIAEGQLVAYGTELLRLLDVNGKEVSAQLPSREADSLRSANTLEFEHDGHRYPLKLRAVLPSVQTASATREVRLDFSSREADSGLAGRLLWQNGTPYVPAEYLVQRDGKLGVYVVIDGKAQFKMLPGAQSGRPAVTTLPKDSRIVINGQFSLTDGATVAELRQ